MAALDTINHLNVTPSRKRKRQILKSELEENAIQTSATTSCFTNAAFSSTPKKILARRRIILKRNTENEKIFENADLETKSIAEIAKHHAETCKVQKNPYEVLRKPPKKKKRHTEVTACFENPALNLHIPDKIFNPYEVVRVPSNKCSNCFSNPALNLKVQDASVLCNPFEVQRVVPNRNLDKLDGEAEVQPVNSPDVGNELGEPAAKPCQFKLGLPFVPRVSCRIDFNDISVSQLTPSKLLAEKLVFSPVPKAKISLGSAGEETTMDIGKELDRYQLELENSINEAKLRKTGVTMDDVLYSPSNAFGQIQMFDFEKHSKFNRKLCDISEDNEIIETNKHNEHHIQVHIEKEQNIKNVDHNICNTNPFRCGQQYEKTETAEIENINELFWCSADDQDEDSFDFKNPAAPFVRAYTKPNAPSTTVSKESLESNISDKSGEKDDRIKKSLNVKNILRKSIRKLIHPQQHGIMSEDDSAKKAEYEKNNGFMNVIRQSLRRKPTKNLEQEDATKDNEISIIDSTERTMKLKSDVIEDVANERKHKNTIKKSTREIRNHFLKSVFHKKQEEYNCH